MLERLQIRDFQRHELFRLAFDPGVTCIVGPSDRGKTAVMRSLRWVFLNKPRGDEFVRWGAKTAHVDIQIDGQRIRRSTGGGVNEYVLGDKRFVSFADKVPDEIAALLNVSDLNFQRQHDAPFWFSETAGQVSKNLNKIINLDIIDSTMSELAGRKVQATNDERVANERLAVAERTLMELNKIEEIDDDLKMVERMGLAAKAKRDAADLLAARGAGVAAAAKRAAALRAAATAAAGVVTAGWCAHGTRLTADRLEASIIKVTAARERKRKLYTPDVAVLSAKYTAATTAAAQYEALRSMIAKIQAQKALLATAKATATDAAAEVAKIEVCPTCKRPI